MISPGLCMLLELFVLSVLCMSTVCPQPIAIATFLSSANPY